MTNPTYASLSDSSGRDRSNNNAAMAGTTTTEDPLVEDSHIAAANAEMTRYAAQMGIASRLVTEGETVSPSFSNMTTSNHNSSSILFSSPETPVTTSRTADPQQQQQATFNAHSPVSYRSDLTSVLSMVGSDADDYSTPHVYDSRGHPAPYYEGPYYIKYAEDGTKVKKRWCKYYFVLVRCFHLCSDWMK